LRRSLPGRTTSIPRRGAPPGAWRSLGLAVPGSGAVRPVHAPSGIRHVLDNNSTDHAVPGKAGEDRPGSDRAVVHGCTSPQLPERHGLSSQTAMLRERSACPLGAADAEVPRGAFRTTPILDAGAQSLRHGLTAR